MKMDSCVHQNIKNVVMNDRGKDWDTWEEPLQLSLKNVGKREHRLGKERERWGEVEDEVVYWREVVGSERRTYLITVK